MNIFQLKRAMLDNMGGNRNLTIFYSKQLKSIEKSLIEKVAVDFSVDFKKAIPIIQKELYGSASFKDFVTELAQEELIIPSLDKATKAGIL